MNDRIYVHLYHGRKSPDEELDDWGAKGPTFGPYESIQLTYRDHVKMHADRFSDFHDFMWIDDLIYYDGMWYADFSIFIPKDPDLLPNLQEYSPEKARARS